MTFALSIGVFVDVFVEGLGRLPAARLRLRRSRANTGHGVDEDPRSALMPAWRVRFAEREPRTGPLSLDVEVPQAV
jgi:hypothetical protein